MSCWTLIPIRSFPCLFRWFETVWFDVFLLFAQLFLWRSISTAGQLLSVTNIRGEKLVFRLFIRISNGFLFISDHYCDGHQLTKRCLELDESFLLSRQRWLRSEAENRSCMPIDFEWVVLRQPRLADRISREQESTLEQKKTVPRKALPVMHNSNNVTVKQKPIFFSILFDLFIVKRTLLSAVVDCVTLVRPLEMLSTLIRWGSHGVSYGKQSVVMWRRRSIFHREMKLSEAF